MIDDGLAFEKDMQLQRGQFIRPDDAFSFITKSFAAAWIYPAVLAAWSYLALFSVTVSWARSSAPFSSSQGSWESCYTTNL